MTGLLGSAALAGGMVLAVAATLLWLRVATSGGPSRHARRATWATLAAAGAACLVLEWALLRHEFAVRYVAENGGLDVPLYFTVTSLWAALDGSLLLWLLILGGYAVLLAHAVPRGATEVHPWAMTVLGTVTVFFFALTWFGANPFEPVHPVPPDGPGPNPLLREHPAMGIHPPLLYAGYAGLIVPFAYAVGALLAGRTGPGWLRATRRWTLIAWTCLTAGILLGAWWSYAVLGWGGYWAWDPVENASLLPWLTATAFLHSALAHRHRPEPTAWPVTLACASFLLVLVGTFLTRSAAVASVHTFTQSALGPMLLGFVLLCTGVVLGLLVWRSHPLAPGGPPGPLLSRGTGFVANAVLLVTLAAVVLTGTLYPVISQALTGARTAVGPAYFHQTAVPVALAVLVLMGVAPLLRWGGASPSELGRRLWMPVAAGLGTVAVVGLLSRPGLAALAGFGCGAFVLTGTCRLLAAELRCARGAAGRSRPAGRPRTSVREVLRAVARRRRRYGGLLAHAGVAVLAVGVAASSAYPAAAERELAAGDEVTVSGVTARLAGVDRYAGDGVMDAAARLVLVGEGAPAGALRPRLRYFPGRDTTVSVPAIHAGVTRDVYATVTAVDPDSGTATVRLAVHPLVGLVWAGGGLTAAGGLLALGRWRRPAAAAARQSARPAVGQAVAA